MPGYDGTGPRGMGPITGGGSGYCAVPIEKVQADGFAGGSCMRRSRGRGRGRGWRNLYYATGLTGWQRNNFESREDTNN